MDIVFDVFIYHPEYIDRISAEEHIFYSELRKFTEQRLSPLRDEIDKIENENADKEEISYIMIYIIAEHNTFMEYHNYPKELRKKMKDSFTQDDLTYIENKIGQLLAKMNN